MTRLRQAVGALVAVLDEELAMIASCLEAIASGRPRPGRRGKSRRRFWTDAERREVRESYSDSPTAAIGRRLGRSVSSVYRYARKMGLRKSEAYMASPAACRLRRGDNVGASFRFRKGHVPANKGLRRPGYAPGRMRETQFKKGEKPYTWVPVGTEVRDPDGYLKRKVGDDRTKPPRFNWRFAHVLVWEAQHGAVPPGCAIAFKNGNNRDIRDENLELVSRKELMRRNSVHNLPKELAEVVQLRGALVRQINRRARA